jgi:hypothetical protein
MNRQRSIFFFCIIICGIVTGLLTGSVLAVHAQDSLRIRDIDSTGLKPDTAKTKIVSDSTPEAPAFTPSLDSLRKVHSPRRAAFYSAVLPGLGQAYNHQYIKIPLMLGGLGVATGVFMFNFDKYITYRDAYRLRLNGHYTNDPRVDVYSPDDLRYLRDGYRQYVDYSVLGFAAVYLYNILDAIVFAHLYHFDISNDLSRVKFGPVIYQHSAYAGFGLTYTF